MLKNKYFRIIPIYMGQPLSPYLVNFDISIYYVLAANAPRGDFGIRFLKSQLPERGSFSRCVQVCTAARIMGENRIYSFQNNFKTNYCVENLENLFIFKMPLSELHMRFLWLSKWYHKNTLFKSNYAFNNAQGGSTIEGCYYNSSKHSISLHIYL